MLTTLALMAITVLPAQQQDARAVMQTMLQKQAAREAGVSNYALIQSVQGVPTPAYYEKESIGGMELFRLVPIPEWQERGNSNPAMNASAMPIMADGLDMLNGPLTADMAGKPGGILMAGYMSNLMTDMAFFARVAYDPDSLEKYTKDGRDEAASRQSGLALFATRARLLGHETIDSTSAFHLFADGLEDVPLEQAGDGSTFTLTDTHMWIDATEYVMLRLQMNATLTADGRTTPITIELLEKDHQRAGTLYLPTRQVMRLSGLMEAMAAGPKQRRELEKARSEAAKMQAQMADMESQLAQMPASARRMIEGQMQKAMTQLDQMLSGGIIEAEFTTKVWSVDKGPPFDWKPGMTDR